LAHTISNKAERAYRRGTAVEKRRALMEAWAAYLTSHQPERGADGRLVLPKPVARTGKSQSTASA